jgi:SAM-dependent methyltransferase
MLFLSDQEQREWRAYASGILRSAPAPGSYDPVIRPSLVPAFHFYIAAFLAAHGAGEEAVAWAEAGAGREEEGISGCAFLAGFLQRYDNRLAKPARVFEDPRPFIHFASVPVMNNARAQFVRHCGRSLPVFDHPIRFMDIGCGNGALAAAVLSHLLEKKTIPGISGIVLVDPSPAMTELAENTLRAAFPGIPISIESCRIQDCSDRIDRKIDIAISSLAYHHMPVEHKRIHLARIGPVIDHFLLFEMDADIDTHDLFSPALAIAVYQSYGRIFHFIQACDAPVDMVNESIDRFLMTEVVSILSEPRGERSDYHMLRSQWKALLDDVFGPEFFLRCDSACYADEYFSLFTLHYGRNECPP